ncbi:hypothetical protein GJA_997 [Janthinobacterium agaricidamnosum NBRC 102515 = DSM 9628]|uniref:Uncharacterized protein n=1 Tax=Janthinobacterium agaricidamnosum NBRC 102515 = DSM 9628 TaxID=1349767 RepID=W0V302_9BURK|nr:hypothetical protein GJA_997 [Janthinobacterium agaricidamnosum NBRC 102515 = DSM 9628]
MRFLDEICWYILQAINDGFQNKRHLMQDNIVLAGASFYIFI